MTRLPRLARFLPAVILLGCLALAYGRPRLADAGGPTPATPDGKTPAALDTSIAETARANELIRRQPGFFVPNLGQWDHPARFVHRSGPMTLFLEDRGWLIDLVERPAKPKARPHEPGSLAGHRAMRGEDKGAVDQKIQGVALRMTFEGDTYVPEIVGEKKLPSHHNYFLGNDESRWRNLVRHAAASWWPEAGRMPHRCPCRAVPERPRRRLGSRVQSEIPRCVLPG